MMQLIAQHKDLIAALLFFGPGLTPLWMVLFWGVQNTPPNYHPRAWEK